MFSIRIRNIPTITNIVDVSHRLSCTWTAKSKYKIYWFFLRLGDIGYVSKKKLIWNGAITKHASDIFQNLDEKIIKVMSCFTIRNLGTIMKYYKTCILHLNITDCLFNKY